MKVSYKVEKNEYVKKYVCYFLLDGKPDQTEKGTYGTGIKLYETKEKADQAGKRYLKKMKKNGFII